MKKLLISGGNGKLAKQVILHNNYYEILAPSKEEMDITDIDSVESFVRTHRPDIFLHAAAYTRPMNKHQENPQLSLEINIIGTANVALTCIKHKIKLAYVSTDYVYPGTTGNYKETDALLPYYGNNDGITKYGWSKLGGEACARLHDNSLILRLCMSNKPFPHPRAAVDIRKSYIYEDDAAKIILKLLDESGIINIGGPAASAYEFALNENPDVEQIKASEIKDVKIAPNTTMDISKMKKILRKNER
jgi:dTDP-4-dehydrorhamnose reductase|tara:strand:- start:9774 stop:10514 length:741 start_codon:yes stop_codon:yes gene_type:complete